jgi:uncharacterized protein (DUF2147 family)
LATWHSIDDKTNELEERDCHQRGRRRADRDASTKLLRKDADQKKLCTECSDDRKDKPVLGMEIIRGAKKVDGKDVWEGGKILDPENGKEVHAAPDPD